jgi:RimJ/RimL family protein N-acetyltransferase
VEVGFAIVGPLDPGHLLGGGSLYEVEREQRRAAVGYWLAPAARGRGYATAAVRLAAGWALAPARGDIGGLGLDRLQLTCAPDNAASRAVAERAGFAYEARLRDHVSFKGGRRDSLVFARRAS